MSHTPTHDSHSHANGICPVAGTGHDYCPPQPGDQRSPCPGLNTLANHGFLPRDGYHITPSILYRALREGYGLSTFFALIFAAAGLLFLAQFRKVSLWDFSRHNCIEHDASLFHDDAHNGHEYAPTAVSDSLLKATLLQGGRYLPGRMTLEDVANIRVKREAALDTPLQGRQADIARDEMALSIGIFGGKKADENGMDLEFLHSWVREERLPDGWKPDHVHGFFETMSMAKVIRKRMDAIKRGQIHNILDDEHMPMSSPKEENVNKI